MRKLELLVLVVLLGIGVKAGAEVVYQKVDDSTLCVTQNIICEYTKAEVLNMLANETVKYNEVNDTINRVNVRRIKRKQIIDKQTNDELVPYYIERQTYQSNIDNYNSMLTEMENLQISVVPTSILEEAMSILNLNTTESKEVAVK